MTIQSTGNLLREVARLHLRLQRSCVAACNDTSSTQCFILGELYRNGAPVTLADLGRQLGLDKGWVSRAVESLAQEGLLVKSNNADDRRTLFISLSKKGEKRYRALDAALNAQTERILDRISDQQRPGIDSALQLLLQALQTESAQESEGKGRKAKCSK